ncbi:DNA methyltransferase [Desulfonatronum thioautotrophicum]|uniref:DNA methyltransferase n=1 Tax=Desulfonatronum thioautotrophicum TaxID=617001 RepID=UPI0009FE85C4|nr:DNA methyltransferase [Desulfonatronum thioautotrophicum]
MPKKKPVPAYKTVETITHPDANRVNIPTAEYQSIQRKEEQSPIRLAYERRNRDLDPQLVWRGKDEQDWSDLVVHAPPLYIQEKVHPKVLIDDLVREREGRRPPKQTQLSLFADFNGIADEAAKTEFYQHDANWTNRMILGDSLQVMASLAEREGLRGKVQCIYFDPPYGIKFNSNFQWSTTSRDVKDGKTDHITREPEQVKAFRDTWRDGIHSYLTYLRDRLTVARDLLTDSGSIFVQIGDENVHRVRALMDEVFGDANQIGQIPFVTTAARGGDFTDSICDYILWYAKRSESANTKYRQLYIERSSETETNYDWLEQGFGVCRLLASAERWMSENALEGKKYALSDPTSQGATQSGGFPFDIEGTTHKPPADRHWATTEGGLKRLNAASRLQLKGRRFFYRRYLADYPVRPITGLWDDTASGGFLKGSSKVVLRR